MQLPYVVTISSEKGGVGKTTLATNLAIYLKALNENLPVTVLSFDNHFTVDRMFRIGRRQPQGDVCDLFAGVPATELLETGEYGVQFIPSSRKLAALREHLRSPEILAGLLADSPPEGVVVIDTRPDLDIYTQNALFAADRVIVPVKDAPSLENCRNLYEFFDAQGLSRRALRLLPCLVDSRIHFDGPFRDPYQLLKAYAINRGYKCLEGYIAKSPKVESLNTNPQGKVYPVLTHGRGTDVHLQFAHLARQVYLDILDAGQRRLEDFRQQRQAQLARRASAFDDRRAGLQPGCLLCGKPLVDQQGIAPVGYYCETSDGSLSAFVEEDCFCDAIFRGIYQSRREVGPEDPLRELFRESAQSSYFVLRRSSGADLPRLCFHRFDDEGLEVSVKEVELRSLEGGQAGRCNAPLLRLAEQVLPPGQHSGDRFLLIRRVSSDLPETVLFDEEFAALGEVRERIAARLPR
ncbi:chromosome partitioning protein ParA [Desulfuromonas versatilis]|uniref:Chromosome partitioning protein ParA n=1 Tax=Desulfuromonas versatilis TaxID=2802975 RepID=A0ABN6E3K9_9BACT|nr:ParA family protein [Desulfuromonas versatilis]BCR05756.1 chromosome partitioning protein ParA [Desulfuromonas versatilis]